MSYEVTCQCGNVVPVSASMAGSSISCSCGQEVPIPSLSELREQTSTGDVPPFVPELRPMDTRSSEPSPLAEVIAPALVFLRTGHGDQPVRRVSVMAALTPRAIHLQDVWKLRSIRLQDLSVENGQNDHEMILVLNPGPSTERLTLGFPSREQREQWHEKLEALRQRAVADATTADGRPTEGVALVQKAPEVPHTVLCPVEFTGRTRWEADRGVQLRAGIHGADAVIELERQKCLDEGMGTHQVGGLAVRVDDAEARDILRRKWYAEDVRSLVRSILLLLVIEGVLLFFVSASSINPVGLEAPTGETPSQALASAAMGTGLIFAWPLIVLALLRMLRWPQLLRAAGIVVLAATSGRTLMVWLAHFLAVLNVGAEPSQAKMWLMLDPVDWTISIFGVVLCVRAWTLDRNARQILPREAQAVPMGRKVWSRGVLAVTGVYALTFLAFTGFSRYESSTHVLQPGFDPRLEQKALLAMNEGLAEIHKGDLSSAEQTLQRAVRLWEGLTARPPASWAYRENLATTLHYLAWIRQRAGRDDEAEADYARAVSLADGLAGDPHVDDDFKKTMDEVRKVLVDLRRAKASKLLDEKDKAGVRKFEEAQVKALRGEAEAERLYQEAITAWEEILPQAESQEYRTFAVGRLFSAYLRLGEFQTQFGKRPAAEATLKKGIDYGEKAVALQPDRPLTKHNLDVAHRLLADLHEEAFQEEVSKLCDERRFADAVNLCRRSIEDEEHRVRSGQRREAAEGHLASRLNRLAWLLAHCPDAHLRDAKLAVKHALRAVELCPERSTYWSTLATVQYRNGDWRDSLASLEKVKAIEGGFDAREWFLNAMDLHQLGERAEARAAFQKGLEWIDVLKRQAQDDAIFRLQYELMQPSIEALRQEAEKLIKSQGPFNLS
jgi:tetratricopeptide (TPR) repeat protein